MLNFEKMGTLIKATFPLAHLFAADIEKVKIGAQSVFV